MESLEKISGRVHTSAVPLVVDKPPFWWFRHIPAFLLAVLSAYLFYLLGREAFVPVLASFAIAYIISPLEEGFRQRGLSRVWSALAALLLVGATIAAFMSFVLPELFREASAAGKQLMAAFTEENAVRVRAQLREFSNTLDGIIGERVYETLRDPNHLQRFARSIFAGDLTGVIATASSVFDLLLIPFFVFYILVDFPRWREGVDDLIPPRFRDPFSRLFDEVGRILQSYVLGQLLISLVMAGLYGIGFGLLDVPAWAGIAAIAGLLNIVPYVGTGAGLLLSVGFTASHGGDLWRILGIVGVFSIVQLIEGYYLTPKVLGGRLRLHPMAVFLGLLVGGRMFGLLGMLLAVPVIAVSHVFLKFFREIYKRSDFYSPIDFRTEGVPGDVEGMIAEAADCVLAEQIDQQSGDEVMAPEADEDDRLVRGSQRA